MAIWDDRLLSLDATNATASTSPKTGTALNGQKTLFFDRAANSVLSGPAFDTGAHPYSFHMVVAVTNVNSVAGFMCSTNNSGQNYISHTATPNIQLRSAGSPAVIGAIETNKWYSIVVIFNGASSQVWTNGIQLGSNGNPGSAQWIGLEIGRAENSTSFDGLYAIAEFSVYTNTVLSSANISNLFSYSTNTYAFGY